MEDHLSALAASQDGIFTTADAHACGVFRYDLARWVKAGHAIHLGRAAYVLAGSWPSDAVGRHRVRSQGALRLYPDAQLIGASLLVAEGVPVWDVPLQRVDLTRPIRQQAVTQGYRVRPPDRVVRGSEDSRSRLATAVVQVALDHGPMSAVCSGDFLLNQRRLSELDIATAANLVKGWPGYGRVRSMLSWLDGLAESIAESRARVILSCGGIETVSQVVIADRGGIFARADLAVKGTKVLIEVDGRVKYASGDPEVLWREKRREDRLRAAGYIVIRVTWADLEHPERLIRRVRAVLRDLAS